MELTFYLKDFYHNGFLLDSRKILIKKTIENL